MSGMGGVEKDTFAKSLHNYASLTKLEAPHLLQNVEFLLAGTLVMAPQPQSRYSTHYLPTRKIRSSSMGFSFLLPVLYMLAGRFTAFCLT